MLHQSPQQEFNTCPHDSPDIKDANKEERFAESSVWMDKCSPVSLMTAFFFFLTYKFLYNINYTSLLKSIKTIENNEYANNGPAVQYCSTVFYPCISRSLV